MLVLIAETRFHTPASNPLKHFLVQEQLKSTLGKKQLQLLPPNQNYNLFIIPLSFLKWVLNQNNYF